MKKLLIVLVSLLILSTICIYLFIPKRLSVSEMVTATVNDRWAFQYFASQDQWEKWWPENSVDSVSRYNGQEFSVDSLYYHAVSVNVLSGDQFIKTKLLVMPVNLSEVKLAWASDIYTSVNPVKRLKQYQAALLLKRNFHAILSAYIEWLNKPENVYGFRVVPSKVVDTILLTKMVQFKDHYPSPMQVDSVLRILRKHIAANGAKQDGYPMLHVVNNHPGVYDAQVAIPLNKEIPGTDELKIKHMFPGNILITRFFGGPYTIQKAYEACENYQRDYQRVIMAIPFQSMITDRAAEPDTSKWETIVNWPVQ